MSGVAAKTGSSEQLGAREAEKEPVAGGAQPYTLGSQAARPLTALPALDRIGERLTRRLRGTVEAFTRGKPRVSADAIAIMRYDEWRKAQPEFTSISLYRFRPLKGGVLISIEPELVSRLVDAFYGGSGAPVSHRAKEFTPTEERILVRLTDQLVTALTELWSELVPVKPQLTSRETNVTYATLANADEPVAVCRFMVGLGHGRAQPIDILYPVAALRAIEADLAVCVPDETDLSGHVWRERMAEALADVRLEARSVLARPQLSVSEVLALAPGDVIPISVPALVPLLVSGRPIALGRIGDQDGRAAIQIEKIEDRSFLQ